MVRDDDKYGNEAHKDKFIISEVMGGSVYQSNILIEAGARVDVDEDGDLFINYDGETYEDPIEAAIDVVDEKGLLNEENARAYADGELNQQILESAETAARTLAENMGLDPEFLRSVHDTVDNIHGYGATSPGDPIPDGGTKEEYNLVDVPELESQVAKEIAKEKGIE